MDTLIYTLCMPLPFTDTLMYTLCLYHSHVKDGDVYFRVKLYTGKTDGGGGVGWGVEGDEAGRERENGCKHC